MDTAGQPVRECINARSPLPANSSVPSSNLKETTVIRKPGMFLSSMFVALVSTTCLAQSAMTHHIRDDVRFGRVQPNGRLANNQVMQLDLVLPLRDPAGLDRFLKDVYNPSSPSYRHFLSVPEFTARFGPTQEQYDAVLRFAKTYGLRVTGGSRDRMEVQVKGSVANVEAAFHVSMKTYRHPTEGRNFFAADNEPTVDLPFKLWHVSGLDNYSIPHPLHVSRDQFAQAHGIDADRVVSHATTGSGPSASFLGSDMRAAYYGGGSLTGAGQNLALLEYYGTNLTDLTKYFTNVGQTNHVPVTLLSTDGTSTSCSYPSCDDGEQNLDMTQAIGMAPGLSSLVMYVGSTDTAIISSMTAPPAGVPLPTAIGCSWGWSPADPSTLDPYFKRMAAQGQNFFAASGDSSTWTAKKYVYPADDAYVVSVGGTDLVTASGGGPWSSETAWLDSGGGISPAKIAIPAWQQLSGVITSTNKGSTTYRNGPDVAANANFTFYTCGDQQACQANVYGGTSFAAPMWAAYIALVNQQLALNGQGPIGFINPTIYNQNVTASTYAADFHDIKSGTSGSYTAIAGFDLVTGWGSPNSGLIAALTGPPAASFTLSASPASVSVVQGSSVATSVTAAAANGFSSNVTLANSALPSGVTLGYNPQTINSGAGSSTLTFQTSSATPAGTYPITITGTGGGITQTTTVNLTVTATAPVFTIASSVSSLSITRSSSGSATISASVTQGSPTIALTATGVPSRVTVSFSPTSITGSTTSKMTVTVNRRATRGTYTFTVKGTSGTASATKSISLTIN
jgi:subtilase family serine protease